MMEEETQDSVSSDLVSPNSDAELNSATTECSTSETCDLFLFMNRSSRAIADGEC